MPVVHQHVVSELEPELRGTLADYAREHPDEMNATRAKRNALRHKRQARVRIVGRTPSMAMPALLTSTSIRPSRSPTSFTKARNAS